MRIKLGILSAALVLSAATAPAARADDYAYYMSYYYVTPSQQGGGTYGTIDLNTGVTSQITSFTPPCCGGSLGYNGLGVVNGQLYTVTIPPASGTDSALLHIAQPNNPYNTSNLVSNDSGQVIADFGSTTSGLYAVSAGGGLLSVSPATGLASSIGVTGLTISVTDVSGISSGGSTLYLTKQSTLYTVNTTTGLATAVGNTTNPSRTYDFTAMVYTNGILYGTAFDANYATNLDYNNYLAEINPLTGAVTNAVVISGALPGTNFVYGLADLSSVSVPLPATLPLLFLGLAGLGCMSTRKPG